MSDDHDHDENIGLAFCLTLAAGLSTVLGALLVFCVSTERFTILPIALAFSAGVMIYVSLVEILGEAIGSFEEELHDSHPDSHEYLAHIYGSLCFFGGIAFGYGLDFIVHKLGYSHDMSPSVQQDSKPISSTENGQSHATAASTSVDVESQPAVDSGDSPADDTQDNEAGSEEDQHLIKTSLITALAIGLHNFPEGLATFVATVADPALGVTLAFAIAIHNIPEGVAVAMPIYFATGSKWKALMWAFFSGIVEPIGGLIGWALIDAVFSDSVYGVLFGFTGGIMVYISFKELLPTARKKDLEDKYTSLLMFAGFLVMDISIVLFETGGGHEH